MVSGDAAAKGPLPSWRDGVAKERILTTATGGPEYVASADRVAGSAVQKRFEMQGGHPAFPTTRSRARPLGEDTPERRADRSARRVRGFTIV